jgi:hypothetical protein
VLLRRFCDDHGDLARSFWGACDRLTSSAEGEKACPGQRHQRHDRHSTGQESSRADLGRGLTELICLLRAWPGVAAGGRAIAELLGQSIPAR